MRNLLHEGGNMSKVIYAADDEKAIRELIEAFLQDSGYEVEIFENGDLLYDRFMEKASDMVILDIMMPGSDGLEICKKLRKVSDVPIIMLTARDTENDFVLGMTIGSDDYITKPFRPTMLQMKIKAIFRRIELEHKELEHGDMRQKELKVGSLRISSYERKIYSEKTGQTLEFSMTEFALLSYLAENPGKAVSREECLKQVWGIETDVETRVVDETIRKIRKKLTALNCKVRIETVWGHGYRIVEE